MSKKYVTRDSNTGQFTAVRKSWDGTQMVREGHSGRFVVGSKGMARLNAVEGIKLSASSRKMFADFESRNMSAEERRRAIIAKHAKG